MKQGLVLAAALFDLGLAGFHVAFWRLFHWPQSLAASGRLNASIMQVMNIMLIYSFLMLGLVLIWLGAQTPPLLLLAVAGFGALRLGLQPFYFGLNHAASKILTLVFLVATLLHLGAAFA
jgi:uncharacterized membrane protein